MCPLLGTWPVTQACALTGNQTGDSLVHRLFIAQSTEPHQPGQYFKYFEYIRFWKQFCKKINKIKSMIQFVAIHHYLPFTILHTILVQVRDFWPQLIWIYFSNESSWATMLKLRPITYSALPLSANGVIRFLRNWVSFYMISSLGTQAYLQVFLIYMYVYIFYIDIFSLVAF